MTADRGVRIADWALAVVIGTLLPGLSEAKDLGRFAVNEHFGMTYDREPVSFDVTLDTPVPAAAIGLRPAGYPCQVEVVEGTAAAVTKARVWTLVSFRPNTFRLSEADVLDWPELVARIDAELAGEPPAFAKIAWGNLRKELGLGRDAKALGVTDPGEREKAAILQALNDALGRAQKDTPKLLAALGVDKQFPEDAAKLADRRPPTWLVEKLHRAAIDTAWGKLVRTHRTYPRHVVFTVHTDGRGGKPTLPFETKAAGAIGGVGVTEVTNGLVRATLPTGGATFASPASPFDLPGPVASIARGAEAWVGTGYLDGTARVQSIECETATGPVYFESRIRYAFDSGRSYRVRARLYASKPYVQLVEDFDLGGAARFVFNYEDFYADAFFRTGDNKLYGWEPLTAPNPCGDFVRIAGQEALARMVVWTQFNYFGGKQETIALKGPDPKALAAAHVAATEKYTRDLDRYHEQIAAQTAAMEKWRKETAEFPAKLAEYRKQLAAHKADPKKVKKPREPRKPSRPRERTYRPPRQPEKQTYEQITHTLAGASIRAGSLATPGGASTAVGGFYVRPDRWTRAKVNHVDLYLRPEVPGDRRTRGVVGLAGAKLRVAMEAWLVDGHREWAIFAVPSGDRTWLAKAHVREGVWPLDRLRRLTLTWNSDGSPVRPEDTAPDRFRNAGGAAAVVLKGTRGRSGLQYFNGSNGQIRWRPPTEGFDGTVTPTKAAAGQVADMAAQAATWYLAADDSAYPAVRAMLPWTDPEALNPFYQGMENMNFSADLYRYLAGHAVRLLKRGHPDGRAMLAESERRFDMALDRYVYPGSGCWEESHGYAGHTIKVVGPLAELLRNSGCKNFLEDVRFARMLEFFLYVHSPVDAEWGNRVVPAVGDHGQSRQGPADRFRDIIPVFAKSKHPEIRKIVARAAWMIREDGGKVPEGVTPQEPERTSRWLRGYGTVMRAQGRGAKAPESFLVLRAGQSWGHHHEDKGSMWFWGRNVHFFGDCSWGAPPGGTYWNQYKQGPASGTQIELVGVTNWTLPCKYAAPWISDDEYAADYDYANARCLYPFNPKLDLSRSTPVALRNGYDRQVLFVHPDLLIVRDNVETTCPTIWRMHSFQPGGTKVAGNRATLASPQGPVGELAVLSPAEGVTLRLNDRDILNDKYRDADGKPLPHDRLPQFNGSVELRWDMPPNTSATWVFGVHDKAEPAPKAELLDPAGRVTRVRLAGGTEVIALLNIEPFAYRGEGIDFEGTVGLVVREGGRTTRHAIRATRLDAK